MSVLISHVRLGKSVLKPVNNVHWNNLHKILKVNQNDTNLSCDKFFRQDELFDKTKDFINMYKDDGIIWYFDNCEFSSEQLIRTLWKLKFITY